MQSLVLDQLLEDGIAGVLDAIASMVGENDAIFSQDRAVTYMEVTDSSLQIARQLQFRYGVRSGDRIIVDCHSHRPAEICGMLGCIRVGAPFVPLHDSSIQQNRHRNTEIIVDCTPTAAIVVASTDNDDIVRYLYSVGVYKIVFLAEDGSLVLTESMAADIPDCLINFEGSPPLYILYTSGSTGKPKGVIGTYQGLINRILWQLETFPWEEDEVVCRRTPITFIDAQAEIWTALLCAVPLWVPPRGELEAQGVASIVRSAAEQGVTRITLIPSQLSLLLDMYSRSLASDWPSLKHVTISGESASSRLVSSFTALLPDVTLVNLYGSTEVAGDVTYSRLDTLAKIDGPSAPIGIPISGNTVYILGRSNDGRWIEAPEQGELGVAGVHLCQGYFGNSPATQEHFIPNPFDSTHPTIFLTGDIVCRNNFDGSLTWLGRVDNQVKVRGVRVEIEDVEAKISASLDGAAVVVVPVLRPDGVDNALVAIVEVQSELALTSAQYMESLRTSRLSSILAPSLVLTFFPFPLTSSGKVNRKELHARVEQILATSRLETALSTSSTDDVDSLGLVIRVIKEVLPMTSIDEGDWSRSFFQLGGDSMSAILASWKLNCVFPGRGIGVQNLSLSLRDLASRIADPSHGPQESLVQASKVDKASTPNRANSRPLKRMRSEVLEKSCWVGRLGTGCGCKVISHSALLSPAPHLSQRWMYKLRKCVDASPVAVHWVSASGETHDRIIIGSHGGDICSIDFTGECDWCVECGEHIEGSVSLDHKGAVFVGSFAANDIDFDTAAVNETMKGCMSAFRVSDGGLLWKTRVLGEIKSSPVVIAAEVWVGAYDGFVYCFDCASGHITRRCNVGAAIFSGLTVRNDGLVIFGATIHGKAFAMSTLAGEIVRETELKSPVYSTPLFNPHEHAIIVGSVGASIVSLKCDDGTVNWEVSVDKPIFSSPQWVCNSSIGEVFVVGSHDGHLRCFSSASGSLIWSTNLGSVVFASPFVYDDYIIATVTGGTIYLVGIQDGAILDSKTLPAEIYSSPVAYNGSVFVGCRDDHLHAFSLL